MEPGGFSSSGEVVLYGAGGHARVVRDILLALGSEVAFFVDDAPGMNTFVGRQVRPSSALSGGPEAPPVVISVGDNHARRRIAEELSGRGVGFATLVHPSAVVSPDAEIGEGTVVMPGAVINSGARIGRHCIVNSGVVVEHECIVGDYAHLSPHATLCGRAQVGEGVWVGAGAVTVQCTSVGAWSVIGAGAVVVRDMPQEVVAYGNPCRVKRDMKKG
ncbi:MAG: acetyltransferase [Alloprevotella sp.]|nr:acetyltransferase [Alloprevotella sp.]